jgi:hypothetical protein
MVLGNTGINESGISGEKENQMNISLNKNWFYVLF